MACRPPMRPKSTPYWNGDNTMMPQATKHFQCAFQDPLASVAIAAAFDSVGFGKLFGEIPGSDHLSSRHPGRIPKNTMAQEDDEGRKGS